MGTLITNILNFLSVELTVFFIAAIPIIELRGAIPVGMSLGMSLPHAAFIAFLGGMLPVPFILFGIRPIFNYLKKTKTFRGMVERLSNKSLAKSENIQKYGFWGLIIFVGIPLPGTGVWTGALIAALLDMRFKLAFPALLIGNGIAAILVMTLSHGVTRVFDYLP